MEKKKLNKAVTDSISSFLDNGINVNVRIETETFVRLIFFAIIVTVVVAGTNYTLHWLKTR